MSSESPRVSMGLPVYNGERYLAFALDSLLAQTYTDFELIISDNASTDGTAAICEQYAAKDQRIRYYRNEVNLGAAPNFNRVFTLARGEYFKWAAYDDLVAPEFLARCVEALDAMPEAVLCCPAVTLIDEAGNVSGEYASERNSDARQPHARFRGMILIQGLYPETYGLIRSSAIRQTAGHGSYPSSDEVFLGELALTGPFCHIPEPLLLRRMHGAQSTSGELTSRRARIAWFDTSLSTKVVLPTWQYFFAGMRAINRADVSTGDRFHSYAHMMRWAVTPANTRALGKDLLLSGSALLRRTAAGATEQVQDKAYETHHST